MEPIADNSFTIYTDASTSWGVGIVISNEFDIFKLHEDWRDWEGSPKDIGWAEFIAVELAVFFLLSSCCLRNRHILVHIDNQGVVGAWKSRLSCNPAQNEVLSCILHMLLRPNVSCPWLMFHPAIIQQTCLLAVYHPQTSLVQTGPAFLVVSAMYLNEHKAQTIILQFNSWQLLICVR